MDCVTALVIIAFHDRHFNNVQFYIVDNDYNKISRMWATTISE